MITGARHDGSRGPTGIVEAGFLPADGFPARIELNGGAVARPAVAPVGFDEFGWLITCSFRYGPHVRRIRPVPGRHGGSAVGSRFPLYGREIGRVRLDEGGVGQH